ncbi:MAG: DNA polymerase III subunit delta [Candidatus Omnitrophica bacterium]|nr:DNA polymerase III subunit delta [Candidatus Omnitrophota bacterium]
MNYLFCGPEAFLKEQAIKRLKSKLLPSSLANQFDFNLYRAGVDSLEDILSCAGTVPFAAKSRLILIKEIDNFSSGDKEVLLKHLKNSSKHTTFIFDSQKVADKDMFLKKLATSTKKINFDKPVGYQLDRWIRDEASSLNKGISKEAVSLIRKSAGTKDLNRLRMEIEKASLFIGSQKEISKSDIEEVADKDADEDIFKLIDAIAAKDVRKALDIVSNLILRKVKPYEIIGLLAWRLRNIPTSGIRGNSLRFRRTKKNMENLLSADLAIKKGRIDTKISLDLTILELCR